MALPLVEGRTAPIVYQLKGVDVDTQVFGPVDITGMTVDLILDDRHGARVTLGGSLTIEDAETGKVKYDAAADDFSEELSPYSARFKVTDGSGKVEFFPLGNPERWEVQAP